MSLQPPSSLAQTRDRLAAAPPRKEFAALKSGPAATQLGLGPSAARDPALDGFSVWENAILVSLWSAWPVGAEDHIVWGADRLESELWDTGYYFLDAVDEFDAVAAIMPREEKDISTEGYARAVAEVPIWVLARRNS